MKTLIVSATICISLLAFTANAQQNYEKRIISSNDQMMIAQNTNDNGSGTNSNGRINEDYTSGHETGMYLGDEWMEGYAALHDNSVIDDIQIRYNIYYQQMQFIKDNDTLAFADPGELSYLEMGDSRFIYTNYDEMGVEGNDYFELLVDGDCQLLKRRVVKYHLNHDPILDVDGEGSFVQCCGLYIKMKGEAAKKIVCNKKGVKCKFKDQEEAIMNFVKSNGLSVKKQEDMAQIVQFYNTLI